VSNFCSGQFDGLSVLQEKHTYTVKDVENYSRLIKVEGFNLAQRTEYISFPVNELAVLSSYEVFEKKGDRWKPSKISKNVSTSTMNWNAFFTGTKNYIFAIPPMTTWRIEFKTKEKHSVFLSKLYRKGFFDADSVIYSFDLADGLEASFGNSTVQKGEFIVDAIQDSLDFLSLLIHPKGEDPERYFSNWFEAKTSPMLTLNELSVPAELVEYQKNHTKRELAEKCFKWVQDRIKYIDIENGINAVVPRQCEKVMSKGLGDCKDMATVLTALYRYFDFEAYLAISKTNSNLYRFDFPSIGLANHMVCALKLDGEWYFLDGTEDACLFGDPSIQILGTEAFLIGNKGNYFVDVPSSPRSSSKAMLEYRFNQDSGVITFNMTSTGKMNQLFYNAQKKRNNPEELLSTILQKVSSLSWTLDSLSILDSVSTVAASARIGSSSFSKIGEKYLYDLSFVPSPEHICLLFQNNEYPVFDADVHVKLAFEGNISMTSSEQLTVNGGVLNGLFKLQGNNSSEGFKESSFVKNWEALFNKPLTVTY
jgi:hypothetical protein